MNYRYQDNLRKRLPDGTFVEHLLDYSHGTRPSVSVDSTVETDLLDDEGFIVTYECSGSDGREGFADEPIDWTCDGAIACTSANPCYIDANKGPMTEFKDFDDWANLDFRGGVSGLSYVEREPDVPPISENRDVDFLLEIDVKPESSENPVNVKSNGVLPIALLSSQELDTSRWVDVESLRFGAAGDQAPARRCASRDVNADGTLDLLCHFSVQEAGLSPGLRSVQVSGVAEGLRFWGQDAIRVVP